MLPSVGSTARSEPGEGIATPLRWLDVPDKTKVAMFSNSKLLISSNATWWPGCPLAPEVFAAPVNGLEPIAVQHHDVANAMTLWGKEKSVSSPKALLFTKQGKALDEQGGGRFLVC